MPEDEIPTAADRIVYFIARWVLLLMVLAVYLFVSVKAIAFLARPPKMACGMPFIGALSAQTFFAIAAAITVALKFYFRADYTRPVKITVYLLILLPLMIAYMLF